MDQIKQAAELIRQAKGCYVLSGAGISTESGIPDFRSPGTGLWTKMDPMEMLSAHVMLNDPEKFYKEGFQILVGMDDVEPNEGHRVIAKWEKEGLIDGVITQNIDNLHQKAGSKNMMEVHGQMGTCHCLNCGRIYDFWVMRDKVEKGEIPPICPACGGTLRTDVVLFGDMMPPAFDKAVKAMEKAELLIVVGTSLTVSPVNMLPRYADRLIIINRDATAYDRQADVAIHAPLGETLKAIDDALHA